jgi:magnesium transporter
MVFYLYVVDARRHLVGVTSLRRLLLVSPETPLKRIMTPDIISVRVDTDQEEVARQVASYNLLAVPVVDEENKLAGVMTVDDVIDVIKDEATEDLLPPGRRVGRRAHRDAGRRGHPQAAAVAAGEPGDGVRRRLGGGAVRGHHPAGHGAGGLHADCGRHGRQRRHPDAHGHRARLALGELSWVNARKALAKESAIGVGNGLALGVVAAGVAWVTKSDPILGLLLGMAMVCNMIVAATAGTLVPLGLKALKVDPALASAVFITTFTDVVGFASFLGISPPCS